MIGHLAAAVDADLRRRKFPYRVTYGPERATRTGFRPGVVFVRDRSADEAIEPMIGAKHVNPEAAWLRYVAGAFTVYVDSPKPGARPLDHEDECDTVADGVLSAMRRILSAKRLPLRVVSSRMLDRETLTAELGGDDASGPRSADAPGCAVRVRFSVGTAVRDVNYKGEARLTGEVFDVDAPVIISDGFDDYDPAP